MGGKLPVKDRALRLLSVRSRSRSELRGRLLRAGFEEAEVEAALDDLQRVGLLDDAAFARDLATRHVHGRGAGSRAATTALRRFGVDPELAERTVGEVAGDDEEARAEAVARRRLSRMTGLDAATTYRRLVGFLQRRGYDGHTAREVCRRIVDGAATT
ncbi:MAG: recombination regulator RecX [Actinomycetota bacterium]|nr:recombination regulator RecX [Actinomycetota bacterium]